MYAIKNKTLLNGMIQLCSLVMYKLSVCKKLLIYTYAHGITDTPASITSTGPITTAH